MKKTFGVEKVYTLQNKRAQIIEFKLCGRNKKKNTSRIDLSSEKLTSPDRL